GRPRGRPAGRGSVGTGVPAGPRGGPARGPPRRCARWRVRPVTAPERAPADLGSMLLLLTRHARAPERDTARWPDDSLRPLTNLGREFHAEMSRALARIDGTPGAVLTSPWVRARQTADLM